MNYTEYPIGPSWLVVWRSGNDVVRISEVTVRRVRPVESQFGARGNYAQSRGPLQATYLSPERSRGPSDTVGPGVAYPNPPPTLDRSAWSPVSTETDVCFANIHVYRFGI